ncbi:Protein dif-1 [Trichinella pseudospiralis]|uniref:Protein dif-1 n=1 Tax=Trichinella pseudospiralis TaxID=6337 RepID=A0A0V1ENP0_TRIPS|nr:Protein dif-1 [Trichinella pseudospiralis]
MVFLFFQLFTSSDQNQHELTKPTEPKRSDYGYSLSYIYDFLGSIWQSDAKDKKICAQKNAYTTSSYVSKENIIQETLEIVRQLGNAKTVHDQLEVVNNLRHHLISFPECRTIGEMRTVTPLLIQWQRKTYGVGLREQLSECLALMGHVQPVSGNGIRLLSIDGGGTRGLMALEILEALESACAGYRIHELFDYMVGVSTGAIIVALIGGLRLNAAECRTIYELVPARLFAQSKISGSLGLVRSHSYYSTETWVTLLRQALGEKTFLQTTHRKVHPKLGLVSCVPNDGRLFPFVFRNYNHPIGLRSTFEGSCQYRLWEAVQASAAAPGYFQECRLHNLLHQDGGMIANNPTAVGIHECRHLWPNIPFQCILSIGNGSFRVNNKRCSTADYSSLRDRIAQIIESATETEMVHRTISDLLQPSTYVRLNPYMSHRYSLDESDVQRLKQMQYDAKIYLRKNSRKIKTASELLLKKKSPFQELQRLFIELYHISVKKKVSICVSVYCRSLVMDEKVATELMEQIRNIDALLEVTELPDREDMLRLREDLMALLPSSSLNAESWAVDLQEDSNVETSLTSDTDLFEQFIGLRCRVPCDNKHSSLSYHNAIIFDIEDMSSSTSEDILVLYINPVERSMQPCKHFLDNRCTFNENCRYSHGETVKFADIIEYEEPDFENLSVGSKCLVKCGSEELWKLASVTSISLEEEQIAARLANTGVLLAVNFEHVFPLNDQSSLKTEVSQTQESLPEALPSSSSAGSARPVCSTSAASGSLIGDWEVHTRGIGTKLMEKMGYIRGQGLGKDNLGQTEPIAVHVFPKGKSVDHCLQIQRNRESKDLPVEKLRVHLDDKKYEAKLAKRTEAVEKFFNMINGHLKTPDANQRKRAAEKGTTVVDISSKKSCHDLQITLLKVGEEVKQMKKRVNSLKQALRRNDGKDSVVAEDLQIKLKLAEEQLQLSLEKQARIEDEVKDRLLFFFCSANCIQINMVENDSESIDLVKQRQDTDPLRNFLAGGIGGVCCVVTGHPFDTIKVRLQTASTATGGFGPSTLSCLKKTVVDEGILALYKGMAAPVVGVAPLFALYFFGCSIGKRLQQANADEQLSIIKTFNAGALSGMMTTLIVAPGERIKCLLQVQHQHQRSEAQYAGPVDVFKKLYKEGGIRSIYRGTVATLLRDVPASGAYLATYEFLMRSMTSSDDTGELSVSKTLLAGGVAGLANWAVALPQDVLKSRLQIAPSGMYPNGMRDVARQLIREEGPLALYRGFTPVMLRAFPANAACFLGYEIAMKGLIKLGLLAVYNDYIHSRLQKHSVRVHVPIMGFQEFTGYFLIAFGTPLAIFLRVIMHDPMRIILFVGAAFFYMLSILVAAIIWFILPHFDGMLCFTVFLFVFLQEIIRYLYYQLIRRAQAGLDLVTEGNEGVEGVHPLKHANHMISFVIGMGFGSMAGIIALVNGLADSSGPGTVGLPSALKLSDMHAISVAALILLHVMWNVIIFHACDKKATWLAMFAIADHFLVTGISFYNRSNAWAASLSCLYGSLLLFSGLAYAISGGNVKNVRLFIRCIFNPRLRAQNPPDVDQRF